VAIDKHTRARQIELGRQIAPRKKVYLDTRYWIIARDAGLGLRFDATSRKLLHYLQRGVANGSLVCPISASVLMEVLKQPFSPDRRIATAKLIDELSLGVSLIDPERLLATEISRFFLARVGRDELYDMQELIWTKAANSFGESHPNHPALSVKDNIKLQKLFFDKMWDCSLSEMVELIGNAEAPEDRFTDLSAETTEQSHLHAHELNSFAEAYDTELKGAISASGPIAARVIKDLEARDAGLPASDRETSPENVNRAKNALYHAFNLPGATRELRTLHVLASLHASVRWDKHRRFKPNDFLDFQHAAAAVSYCDVFLTEKPLAAMVNAPRLQMKEVNGCEVLHDLSDAAEYLRSNLSLRSSE
jgi:hypothetical protein